MSSETRSPTRSTWGSLEFFRRPEASKQGGEGTTLPDSHTYIMGGRSWHASGRLVPEGFKVLAGSTVNSVTESFAKAKSYYPVRMECEALGVIVDGKFVRDCTFKSAAQAACIVAAALVDARRAWTTKEDGKTFTYGEMHPKVRRTRMSPQETRRRLDAMARRSEARLGIKVFCWESGGFLHEHRGQVSNQSSFERMTRAM